MLNFFSRKDKAKENGVVEAQEQSQVTEQTQVRTPKPQDKEIVFSKTIKAGKRVYFLDVKKDRRDELFLSITESKRKGVTESGQFLFEKHKIFLYKEDFDKFEDAMTEVLSFMREQMPAADATEAEVETEQ